MSSLHPDAIDAVARFIWDELWDPPLGDPEATYDSIVASCEAPNIVRAMRSDAEAIMRVVLSSVAEYGYTEEGAA
jgi:hypothetical protein